MTVLPNSGSRRPGLREVLDHPLGPTAWQLNYWRRSGYVPELSSNGHYAPPIPEETQRRLIEMARLTNPDNGPGVKHDVAAKLSRLGTVSRSGRRVIPAGPGITIIIDAPDRIDT